MPAQRSARQRSASYDRSVSEGLVDLNVFVVPPDVWRNNLTSSVNQIVTDSLSAGYIRVHPESILNDLRKEIDRQLGYDAVPRDYIFLRCLGRCFTQVKAKQEFELKVKYFVPPRTYSPELYILNASAVVASRFSISSHSSQPSVHLQAETTSRLPPFLPPAYGTATLPTHQPDLLYRDRDKPEELSRRKHEEDLRSRQEEEAEEEEKRRRKLREEEEENERTKRLIEELEMKRREELEERRRKEEEEDLRRMRRLEEEEEEDRLRLRRLIEEDGRRQQSQDHEEEISRPRTPSPSSLQRSFDRNEPRDLWKKRFFEEKKRTGPREDNTKILKEELDNINRKIIDQMEAIKDRDSSRKPEHMQNSLDRGHKMKLEATRMENEIEDLQSKLQSTKMQLTSEMKLRNQSEREVQLLQAELEQLKTKPLPRLDDEPNPRAFKAPIYTNHRYGNGNDEEGEDPEYDEPVVKKSVQLTYREPKKAPKDMSPAILPEPPAPKTFATYQGGTTLEEAFRAFATKNNGLEATGADIFKWCIDAGILGKSLNNHHIDISYCKVRPKGMKTITMKEMNPLLDELAVKYREDMKLSFQAARRKVIEKLSRAPFKLHGATLVVRAGAVDRLTDVTKYTGSHKTGKGKARDGKESLVENSGYVSNYKLAGSYDKTY